MMADPFSQQGAHARLEWGRRGAAAAAARGDVVVIVDVLRFSTAVTAAVSRGCAVYPCAPGEEAAVLAAQPGAELAGRGRRLSLSPGSFLGAEPGCRVVLPSPNGAACCRLAARAPAVLVGALVNAAACARAASAAAASAGVGITVVACGERWTEPDEEGPLRVAVEDYLGAGAVLSALSGTASAEAAVCAGAFRTAAGRLEALLAECGSGRELRARGEAADVRAAAALDAWTVVPVLRQGWLQE